MKQSECASDKPSYDSPAWDTDSDGMPDGWEVGNLLDPLDPADAHGDLDTDGLTNLQEHRHGTDQLKEDTDDDGLEDGDEVNVHGTNPLRPDTDGDGFTDLQEITLKANWPCLDPLAWDSDGDMLPDGWELQYGLSPCECAATNSLAWDADNDGLGLLDEYRYCTDPFNPDTDGDGVWDGDEVPHSPGSCPCDADDEGDPANCVTLKLTVGDPSGSNSERWNFEVSEEATGRTVVRHCDDGFGTPGSAEYALVKGKAYTLSLKWGASDPAYTGTPKPDYDWQALINDSDEAGAREGLYGTGAFIVEDSYGLLTEETHGNEFDITIGETGRIIVPKIVTETVATSPPDRARKTIGVGEEVTLRVLPEGVDVFLWDRTQGGGDLSYYSGSTTTYTAPGAEDDVTITATVEGADCSVSFSVIEPTGVLLENKELGPTPYTVQPTWMSMEYQATIYLQPDSVNFYRVLFYESAAEVIKTGYFTQGTHNFSDHPANGPHHMTAIVIPTKGTLAPKLDIIGGYINLTGSTASGDAYWNILWSYEVPDGTPERHLETIRQNHHVETVNGTLRWTLTKDQSGYWFSPNMTAPEAVSQ